MHIDLAGIDIRTSYRCSSFVQRTRLWFIIIINVKRYAQHILLLFLEVCRFCPHLVVVLPIRGSTDEHVAKARR